MVIPPFYRVRAAPYPQALPARPNWTTLKERSGRLTGLKNDDFRKEMEARLDATESRVELRLNEAAMEQQRQFLELQRQISSMHAEVVAFRGEVIVQIARLDSDISRLDANEIRLESKIDSKFDRAIAPMVQWMVGLHIASVALLFALILHLD